MQSRPLRATMPRIMSSIPPSLPAIAPAAEVRPATVKGASAEERAERMRVAIANSFEMNRATYEALAKR